MKRTVHTLFLALSSLILFSQKNSKEFEFNGKIISKGKGYAYLSFPDGNNKIIRDSCLLKNGKFSFKGRINEPTLASFRLNIKNMPPDGPNITSFYIEPGRINAIIKSDRLNEMKITGSNTQRDYEQLQSEINAIAGKGDSLNVRTAEIQRKFTAIHPDSYVSAYILSLVRYKWPVDTLGLHFSKLDPSVQKSFFGKRVAKYLSEINNNSIGKMAKEFTAGDINNKQIGLSDFKGKYVLLNFWASWCKPCRESTPHLMEIYKKYNEPGFEVIAISGDEDINAWKKAIEKDNMGAWYNLLSEQKGDSVRIHDKYAVYVFPTLILIDKNGLILKRYMGSEEEAYLDKHLEELFERK